MSKEAMQAVALDERVSGAAQSCLLWMAYFSRDEDAPYTSTLSQRTLAGLLNVKERMVRHTIERLIVAGVLSKYKQGRTNVYALTLAAPDPASYGELFAPAQHRQHLTDDTTPATSYPYPDAIEETYYRSPEPTPATSYQEHRQDVANNTGNKMSQHRQHLAESTYMRSIEKRDEKGDENKSILRARDPLTENQPNGEAEADETLPPLPPLPDPVIWPGQNASFIWRATLEYLHLHPDIDHWDVSEDDLNLWAKHVIVTLPSPNRVMFRTKSELLTPAFRGATSAAVGVLSDHRMQVEYKRP